MIQLRAIVPIKVVSKANVREHWSVRQRRARSEHKQTYFALAQAGNLHRHEFEGKPVVVVMTRIFRGHGQPMDTDDNLPISMKCCRDAVADWLGRNDADPTITWRYEQRRDAVHSVEVRISTIEAAATSGAEKGGAQ